MKINFNSNLFNNLKTESSKAGISIPALVVQILTQYYTISHIGESNASSTEGSKKLH